jgi:hypothetical protein
MPYGENKKLMDAQSAVPMANPEMAVVEPMTNASLETGMAPPPPTEMVKAVPLSAESEFPDEDISQGLLPPQQQQIDPDISRLKTTYLPLFVEEAGKPNAPVMFRDFVKWLNNL